MSLSPVLFFKTDFPEKAVSLAKEMTEDDDRFKTILSTFRSLMLAAVAPEDRAQYLQRLHLAIETGCTKRIDRQHLRRAEALINDHAKITPKALFLAASKIGFVELLNLYKRQGVSTNTIHEEETWYTPIHYAAFFNQPKAAAWLIKNGVAADSPAIDPKGWTPLHLAAQEGNSKIVKLLLDAGAEINRKEGAHGGCTPLSLCGGQKHARLALYLLARGADPLLATDDGKKPLASFEGDELVSAFTQYKPTTTTYLGKTPVDIRKIIYKHIPGDDLLTHARLVCKEWNKHIIQHFGKPA